MADYNFQTPCEEQNLSAEELKKCQQQYKEIQARIKERQEEQERQAEMFQLEQDEDAMDRFETIFKNTGGGGNKSRFAGSKAFEKRQEEIKEAGGILKWYENENDGKYFVDKYIETSKSYKNGQKNDAILDEISGDIKKIYESRQGKGKIDDEEFLKLWREQDGFEERYINPMKRGGRDWKEESGYNEAQKIYQQQQQQLSNDEIAAIYGEDVLKNFEQGSYTSGEFGSMETVEGLDISLLDEKIIEDTTKKLIKREAELILGQSGERDVDSILMPSLEKHLYTDKDRNEDGDLPNEAILKYNEKERLRFMQNGCGGATVADAMPLGQTVECKGEKYTLKRFEDPSEILKKYQEGQKQLVNRSKALGEEIKTAQEDVAPLLKDINDLKAKIENYGEITADSGFLARKGYSELVENYKAAVNAYNNSEEGKQLERLAARSTILNEEYELLEKQGELMANYGALLEAGMLNYNLLDKTFATLNAQFIAPIKSLTGSIDNALGKLFDKEYSSANLKSSMNYYKMAQDKLSTQFSASIGSADFGKDGFSVGRYLLNLGADNSFSIGATLLPGGIIGNLGGKFISQGLAGAARKAALATAQKMAQRATMATFFVSGSGDQWGKLALAQVEAESKIQKIEDDLRTLDLTPAMKDELLSEKQFYESQMNLKFGVGQRAFASILYGGMDMIGEKLGSLRVISNLQKVGKSYAGQGLFGAWRKSSIEGIKATLASGYRFGAGIGSELLEESFVNLGTAFVDREVLGIDRGYLDDFSTDFALNTAFTSIALQSPYMSSNVMNGLRYELMSNADRKAMRKIHGELMGITTKLENGKLDGNLTKAEIQELEDQKQNLFESASVSDFLSMNQWTKLDANSRQQLIEISGELRAAEKDLSFLTNDPQFGKEGFMDDVKTAEQKVNEIDARKQEILKSQKAVEYSAQEIEYLKQNPGAQLANSIVAEGRRKIYEAALDITGFQYDGTTNVLADPESVEAYIKENNIGVIPNPEFDSTKPESKENPKEIDVAQQVRENLAFINPDPKAKGQLIINQNSIYEAIMTGTTSQALTAAVAPLHELMHAQIKAKKIFDVKNDPALQKSIDTATQGLSGVIQSKIDNGKLDSERGQELLDRINEYNKSNIEEVMTVFGEAVLLGDIKPNDMRALFGLKNMLNSVFGSMNPTASNVLNPFKTTNDIYSFVSNFAERTANVEGGKVRQTFTMDSTGRTKYESGLIFSRGDIKSGLDNFVQNPDGSKKYESKEDFQKSDDYGNALNEIENTNLLDGLIKQGVSQEYLDMNPEFVRETKERIGEKFMNEFDPNKNESLFGWLTGPTQGGKGQSILGFAKGDIQNIGKKNITTQSISDPKAKEIAEQTTDDTTTTKKDVTPTINAFDFLKKSDPNFDSKKFENDFIEAQKVLAKEKGINLADPNLTPKQRMEVVPYQVLADAIGIPVKKLTDPKANLTPAEASKAQRVLTAAKPFIKNVVLSKAYTDVTTVASKKKGGKPVKVGGETLGLGTKILNTFFNPPKRLGSGKKVRTPKQFDNKKFDEAIGVKDGKVSPDFDARNSQIIKGLLKAVAEQMGARATSKTLDAGPQTQEIKLTQAQLDSMKSPLVFSKAPSNIKTKIPKFKKDAEGKKQYKEFLQQKLFPLFPKSFFLQGGDSTLQFLESKGQYFSKTEIDNIIKEQGDNFGKPFPKGVDLKYINKRYNQVFPQGWASMLEMHSSGELTKMNDSNALLGKAMWDRIYRSIRTAVDTGDQNFLQGLQTYMAGVGSIDNHPLKMIAPVVGGTVGYQKGKENVTYEHARPASDTYNLLVNAAIGYKSKKSFDKVYAEVMKNYKVIALAEVDGAKVDKFYKTKMPEGVTEWNRRYANPKVATIDGGVDVNNIYLFDQGKVFSDAFNMDAAGKPLTKEGKKIAEAFTRKYQTLDNGIKFSLSPKGKKAIDNLKNNQPKNLDKDFNDIIQDVKGIKSEARFSDIGARRAGRGKGKFRFFLPPGAEDFKGLIYNFLGKGKKGEKQFEFFDNNLIKPYQQAVAQIERFRRALKSDYATLLKGNPDARKKLNKEIPTKGKTKFTYDQAVRAFLMDQSGFDLTEAGLSKRDAKLLVDTIANDQTMLDFAQGLQLITKQDVWLKPNGGFDVQTIQSDLHRLTSGEGRKKFLENSGFMQNSADIFSKDNLNKIEAAYGIGVREAIEDMMYRMKNGTNRPSGTNRLTNSFNNWVNRSIGAIMFFNRKSALLQTISSINFINWSDNNPLKAAMAFANQKQYWTDFARIFNSPKLKERRAGLKGDINEAELASAVEGATNKAEAALAWLLKKGFLPTQMADSFAIASGGATFYRNRINTYKKQGLSDVEAEKRAFEDFSRISEESQQSADPSMISEQQASPLGRLILAFQNTPMQYTRLMKRAGQDLINGRGDAKTHVSKILYYGAIQNFMFAALQNALFALVPGFGGEDEEEEVEDKSQKKYVRIANNMVDTVLRGSGIYGAIASTLKNTVMAYMENEKKDPFAKDNADILIAAINLSPPIGSKVRKLNNALRTKEFEKDVIEERGWEITRDGRLNLSPSYRVLGSTAEALANIPIERLIAEISALTEMTDERNSNLERVALGLGWRTWDLGIRNEEHDQIKLEAKERKKKERSEELKRKREEEKRLKEEARFEGLTNKEINALKRRDQIEALTKQQQIDSLIKLGVSKKDIRALRLESDRIDKIIELNTK